MLTPRTEPAPRTEPNARLEPAPRTELIPRVELAGAEDGRLFFAQVREDPRLEVAALKDHLRGPIVIVTSGGCTALTLLAAGAQHVVGVDLNRTQNHVCELKAVAVAQLGPAATDAFIGGSPLTVSADGDRLEMYQKVRSSLSPGAQAYWDAHSSAIRAGVLNAGVTERLMRVIARSVRLFVHGPRRVERLLAQSDQAGQRRFYDEQWNTRRWRVLFQVLCNRLMMRRTYDPAFFEHVSNPSFARHFHHTAELALRELPANENYFLHFMFTGRYPPTAGPAYLDEANRARLAQTAERLTLVDGGFADYLKQQPDGSIAAFVLSNICEWLTGEQIDDLFAQIVRTAQPRARLVFRNFVGWTEVPQRWRGTVLEDKELGASLTPLDRSLCQRRIVVCDIGGAH
jgi:S-adenosylmethionine-diacylglycerol 3-amino-3-carboxypropyl transferase